MSEGVEAKMFYLKKDIESDIVAEILDSKAICLGVPTMMNGPFPRVGKLMYYLDCLRFGNTGVRKKAVLFSSKGWAGGAIRKLTENLNAAGFDVLEEDAVETLYVPTDDVLDQCYEVGKKLAQMVKE